MNNTRFFMERTDKMIRELAKSIREYKKLSIITPILISLEVVIECTIPFITASLVNKIKSGCDLNTIIRYGAVLVIMAVLSLMFGAIAGSTAATASCGFAKNLRKDMFYSIQNYSFENIDKFMTSSLITRMTTDVTNVQNAYMMIIRTAIRCSFNVNLCICDGICNGWPYGWIFLVVVPILRLAWLDNIQSISIV